MNQTYFLKAAVLSGLVILGTLIFWHPHVPVQQLPPETGPSAENVAAKSQIPSRISKREIPSSPNFFQQELAKLLAEMEGGTNAVPFDIQAEKLQAFVENLSTNDLALAFRELSKIQALKPTKTGRDLQLRLLQRWAVIDIRAAAQGLNQFQGTNRSDACERIAAIWARQNLSESIGWAQQLSEGSGRQEALLSIASEVAFTNPKEALVLASQITVPQEKSDLIDQAASTWASTAPETAVDWAKQIQDSNLREQVVGAIATTWADKDPIAAAKLVLDSLPEGKTQENAIFGIVQRMTVKNPEAARTWVEQFPEGPLRDTVWAEINRISERQSLVETPK